jgi:alanine-glyoxylate transaminase / serine-glyoxylate transaminase / serine-pyruvate transaminase
MPEGHDADRFRKITLDTCNISLGTGLTKLAGRVFRIGHLGECNEVVLLGALAGIERGLAAAGVPHRPGGVTAAIADLAGRNDLDATLGKAAAE